MFGFFFIFKFIYFWDREGEAENMHLHAMRGVAERERDREFQVGSKLSAQSPIWGLNSWIMRSWRELKPRVRRLTNWAPRCPVIPFMYLTFSLGGSFQAWCQCHCRECFFSWALACSPSCPPEGPVEVSRTDSLVFHVNPLLHRYSPWQGATLYPPRGLNQKWDHHPQRFQ